MANKQNTEYGANREASIYHRITGRKCYGADLDMFEYTYDADGNIVPVAIIDYKHLGDTVSDCYSAMQLQITLAKKLKLPFFVVITYLDEKYDTKMYYVIPANISAKRAYKKEWMSLMGFSKFLHKIRNDAWNPFERLLDENVAATGLAGIRMLKDLPDNIKYYELPSIYL